MHVEPSDYVAKVWAVDGLRLTSEPVSIAYRDFAGVPGGERPTIVFLHGSPGRKEEFDGLAPILARSGRVVVPDLPGFGSSTRVLPDYSSRAHALYVRQLLDRLGIPRAHLLGYSMGGGVALNLTDQAPERVASLTLLSAVGVQEMELTGDYYVNHAVHGVQLGALWILHEGTPHMGLLDDAMLGVPYARNFYDSDQRPLRAALGRLAAPMLIIHGLDDPQVPIEAAREHWRLVPQSELITLPGNHFLLFSDTAFLGSAIADFVRRAATGRAPARNDADPERVPRAAAPFDPMTLPKVRGIAAVVFCGVLAAGVWLASGVASVAAGMFVARGRITVGVALIGCLVGEGAAGVTRYIRAPDTGRGAPVFSSLVSAMQSVVFLSLSVIVSSALLRVTAIRTASPYTRAAVLIALVAGSLQAGLAVATSRRRRLLVSRWRRITQWEFWPPWIFYPPVLVYLVCLMAKHRSATVFTAANPAILAGGVVGESKHAILEGLAGSGDYVARSCLVGGSLSPEAKLLDAGSWMASQRLTFPIVVKPNCGQRGSGVVIVRSEDGLADALARSSVDTIVQEYVGGAEFGVFYYRRPSEPQGHIFSVTEKRLPIVVGDGRRTLEQLILHDDRAVCAAQLYLDRHRDALSSVPAAGEAVPLAELGTHCRGALFLDGGQVLSPALEERFDRIARGFEGFYFGRFDVRLEGGIEEFRAGRGFKIIELNGVTSEATHIYHPGTPLAVAYRVLMRQWQIAFEIGAENRLRGVPPTSTWTIIRLARDYARISRRHLREGESGRGDARRAAA